jgi:hypothetical protein
MSPTHNDGSTDLHTALIGIGLIGAISSIAIFGLLRLTDALAPQVGDIISFHRTESDRPYAPVPVKVLITRGAHSVPCILDVNIMRTSGGSMVLEDLQFSPHPSYRVHWEGRRTSDGYNDCGASVDMVLSRRDVIALKSASVGWDITADGQVAGSMYGPVFSTIQ